MSSEDSSLIANQPFIRKFVYAIIQNIRAENFSYEEKITIHADLVPNVSEKVMQASLKSNFVPSLEIMPPPVPRAVVPRRKILPTQFKPRPSAPVASRFNPNVVSNHAPPVKSPSPVQRQAVIPQPIPYVAPVQAKPVEQVPLPPEGISLSQEYGRITPLLHDESVSTIECAGVGRPIMVIRAGQKQITKITLNAKEIKDILIKVSENVHIPLLEGVFRAAVDNFSINAVISEMIGSRFVIKKQNAYALLEKPSVDGRG